MDPRQSGRLTVLFGAGRERAIGYPARAILGDLDESLTMSQIALLQPQEKSAYFCATNHPMTGQPCWSFYDAG